MKEIVRKLINDMRRRLSRGAAGERPKPKEIRSWGGLQVPLIAPLILWSAYLWFCITNAAQYLPPMAEWLQFLLFSWPGCVVAFFVLVLGRGLVQRQLNLSAYKKILLHNERFTLVEYSKYLGRQIKRAEKDPAMGNPEELNRLKNLQQQLTDLLRDGAGYGLPAAEGELAKEASVAEALVTTYTEAKRDPLTELDIRLPEELRQRVEKLDRELLANKDDTEVQQH